MSKRIPLMECFGPTIQGEGALIGQQTYFLRFGLCDYKCTMCDSMHAVDPRAVKKHGEFLDQKAIAQRLFDLHKPGSVRNVTFTGGNPCIHDLTELVECLTDEGWVIYVETQGTMYPEWLQEVEHVVVSPKGPGMGETLNYKVLEEFMENARYSRHETSVKVVVFDQRDLDFAADIFRRYGESWYSNCYLSLGNAMPPDTEGKSNPEVDEMQHMQLLLDSYRVLFEDIQTHEILSQAKFLPQWHVFVWGNGQGH